MEKMDMDSGSENDTQGQSAPEGMIWPIKKGDMPDLDGLQEGARVHFEGDGQICATEGEEGGRGLQIMHIDAKPSDNPADTELARMTSESRPAQGNPPGASEAGQTKGF